MNLIKGCLIVSAMAFPCAQAFAQVTIPDEYDKTIKAANVVEGLGNDLFGEQVNLYTGATSFHAVDVSLKGNNALPVEIHRSFTVTSRSGEERSLLLSRDGGFADWELEIPYLEGVYASGKGWQSGEIGSNLRCASGANEAPLVEGQPGGFWTGPEYWHGNSLHLPTGGAQELLGVIPGNPNKPASGGTYLWMTNSQWFFSCLGSTANGIAGDAFLGIDPSGTRYTFNWVVSRRTSTITKAYSAPIDVFSTSDTGLVRPTASADPDGSALVRDEVRILPTRVEDIYGNYVTYTYDSTKPWRLLSIVASDGRSLSLSHDANGHISSVSDGTRTWSYAYANGLTQVSLPDQSTWAIDFSGLRTAQTKSETGISLQCERSGATAGQDTYVGTLIHPSGATGTFRFKSITHGRSYVPKSCFYPDSANLMVNFAWTPFLFNQMAIQEKQIIGPGISSTATWTYSYGATNHSWQENCTAGCTSTKTIEVVGPEGDWVRYTYGNRYKYNEGQLLKTERGAGPAAILSAEEVSYQNESSGQNYPAQVGVGAFTRGDGMSEKFFPTKKRTTTQEGRTFTWQVSTDCGSNGTTPCFDQHARPTKVVESSAPAP